MEIDLFEETLLEEEMLSAYYEAQNYNILPDSYEDDFTGIYKGNILKKQLGENIMKEEIGLSLVPTKRTLKYEKFKKELLDAVKKCAKKNKMNFNVNGDDRNGLFLTFNEME